MSKANDMRDKLLQELDRLRGEISRLRTEEAALVRLQMAFDGASDDEVQPRKRHTNVKPLVLDIMTRVGFLGATASEVVALARIESPDIAPATITSLLSRLKADGALVRDGDRYFDARYIKDQVGSKIADLANTIRVN